MNTVRGALLGLVLFAASAMATARATHPSIYVDEGACPFECCTYRDWTVERTTILLSQPNPESKKVGVLNKGGKVEGLTGKVIIFKPGQIRVVNPHVIDGKSYAVGGMVWVYTYLGDGNYKVWNRGAMSVIEAPYPNEGFSVRNLCARSGTCWGRWVTQPKSVWWVKVKTANGVIGWSDKTTHFGNVDACG